MTTMEIRAKRVREAVKAYRDRGGSLKGLERESGVKVGTIYRAMNKGTGLGAVTAARLAPFLGVPIGFLLGTSDEATSEERANSLRAMGFFHWWNALPDEVRIEVRRYADALQAAHTARSGRSRKPGREGRPLGIVRKGRKKGA